MRLIFHGAAREVGRSCIEIQTGGDRYILDCGVKFTHEGFEYPEKVFEIKELDGVLLSHAHLDHTGALPMFEHYEMLCPIFCTHETLAITKALLKDSFKIARIQHLHPAYDKRDLQEVERATTRVKFDTWYRHRQLKFMFLNAGHIPGSAMILIEAEGKRLLYTGDFNTRETRLMAPASFTRLVEEHGAIDTLITECTYGHRTLPRRDEVEPEFLDEVQRIVARGGVALLPVFAVGRAQEILIILAQRQWTCPIFFDGMAKEVTRSILTNQSDYVTNKDTLNGMYFDKAQLIASEEHREKVAQERPAIIVATSGMLQGGPVLHYLKYVWQDPKSAILLAGYQVEGTNGRHLLEDGYAYIDGWRTTVRCEVKKFDFSGHADIEDVKKAVFAVNPKRVIFQHGDEESVVNMVAWAKAQTPFEAYGPHVGETIDIDEEPVREEQPAKTGPVQNEPAKKEVG